MIVALDATALILLVDREASGPPDKATGRKVEAAQERLAYLATRVTRSKGRIVIPTPAFAEAVVKVDPVAAQRYLAVMERLRGFRVAEFSKVAALEFAAMQQQLLSGLSKRRRKVETETKSRAKFDQQIVAIARVERSDFIISDDEGLASYASLFGLKALGIADLDIPPSDAQGSLDLDAPVAPIDPPPDDAE